MFVSNRIKKIIETTSDLGIIWKYCPSSKNLADHGSRGASVERLKYGIGPLVVRERTVARAT